MDILRYGLDFEDSCGISRYSVDLDEFIFSSPRIHRRKPLTNKTIVLDMDLTLLCTIGDGSDLSHKVRTRYPEAYDSLVSKGVLVPTTLVQFGGSGKAMNNDVIKRPGVEEFLTFCRYVFKNVILWSAGQPSYVYDTVEKVLDPTDQKIFDHVYTSQDVVQYKVEDDTGNARVAFPTKPLSKVFSDFPDANLQTTIIVDDLACNFAANPKNGILIPPFNPHLAQILTNAEGGDLENICGDYSLFSLIHFFADDDFLKASDVREYDLRFFFTDGVPLKK